MPFPEIDNMRVADDDQFSLGHVKFEMPTKLLREGVKKAVECFRESRG